MVESVTAIASNPKYHELEGKHNRHLNMLADNDRNLRRQALIEFNKVIDSKEFADDLVEFYYREKLIRRLVLTLEDQIEKNRELSIEIMTKAIERFGLKDEGQILLPAIANRMRSNPFAESSEEVRVELIGLLDVCLESDKFQFMSVLGQVCSMLGRATTDSNPDMKQKVASFSGKLCRELREHAGHHMKMTIVGLTANLTHQHSKVRKITLRGLKDVAVARGAEPFLSESIVQLKYAMNDRSQDVRLTFYEVLRHWMKTMEFSSLKQHEPDFIQFLLNGIADDNPQIRSDCLSFLEEHGARMREALQALGEEGDEDNSMNQ